MSLEQDTNYIISGLERSGTSMLMQMINAAKLPIGYDDSRKPDENNPKGYYELDGGKIINRLMEKKFCFEEYKGSFIKITCYGLKFLPKGKYKIIYSERNIEEILDSMENMMKRKDPKREETKEIFLKLNEMIKNLIANRDDIEVLFVNYNETIKNPELIIKRIVDFLDLQTYNADLMISAIDKKLYRQRHQNI